MPDISARALAVAVQAIDSEIRRLRALDSDMVVAGDEEMLLQYDNVADELEAVYAEAARSIINLPPYADLVKK